MTTPSLKTAPDAGFHTAGFGGKYRLFTTTPGIPLEDALLGVSILLGTAMGEQALEHDAARLVHHTLESATAVVDSLLAGIADAEQTGQE